MHVAYYVDGLLHFVRNCKLHIQMACNNNLIYTYVLIDNVAKQNLFLCKYEKLMVFYNSLPM